MSKGFMSRRSFGGDTICRGHYEEDDRTEKQRSGVFEIM